LRKVTTSFVMSVRLSFSLHAATRLPLDGFWWSLMFEYYSEIQISLTTVHLWKYLAQFFLEWELLQKKVVEEFRTSILCSMTFLSESCFLWGKTLAQSADHRWQIGACALHSEYLKLQTHTRNMQYLMFSSTTMVARTPLFVTLYVHCLSCLHIVHCQKLCYCSHVIAVTLLQLRYCSSSLDHNNRCKMLLHCYVIFMLLVISLQINALHCRSV
jgi:hypothetical protein